MLLNTQLIRSERESKNWTQQHLADVCDVSLRTIQRIEKTGEASSESLAALASVFELPAEKLVASKSDQPPLYMKLFEIIKRYAGSVYIHTLTGFSTLLLFFGYLGLYMGYYSGKLSLDPLIWMHFAMILTGSVLLTVNLMRPRRKP